MVEVLLGYMDRLKSGVGIAKDGTKECKQLSKSRESERVEKQTVRTVDKRRTTGQLKVFSWRAAWVFGGDGEVGERVGGGRMRGLGGSHRAAERAVRGQGSASRCFLVSRAAASGPISSNHLPLPSPVYPPI